MDKTLIKTTINEANLRYYGIDLEQYFRDAGKKIASRIVKSFGKDKSFCIIAGSGGNGTDGLATALSLAELGVKDIAVYIPCRITAFENEISKKLFDELKSYKVDYKQDCYADDIKSCDIVIEAMVGTGLQGIKLNKRYYDIVKRFSHFNSLNIAIDIAAPHYEADNIFSISYAKQPEATTIRMNYPQNWEFVTGPGEVKALFKPNKSSHKSKNGNVLLISDDSDQIHLFTTICKEYTSNFESFSLKTDNHNQLEDMLRSADTIVLGDFDEINIVNSSVIQAIFSKVEAKKFVLSLQAFQILQNDIQNSENDTLIILKEQNTKLIKEGQLKGFCIENKVNISFFSHKLSMYNFVGDMKFDTSSAVSTLQYKNLYFAIASVLSAKNDLYLSSLAANFISKLAVKLDSKDPAVKVSDAIGECLDF